MTDEIKSSDAPIDRDDRIAAELRSNDIARQLAAIDSILAAPEDISSEVQGLLIACIGAERKLLQRRAIDALAATANAGDCRVREALERTMVRGNRRARFGAAYALAQLGGDNLAIECAAALCEALGDDDGDIRWAASVLVVQLGRAYRDEVRARMISLAADGNPNARKMALYCIRDLGIAGADVLALLERAARDANVHIRLAALSVLAKIDDSSGDAAGIALKSLESDPDAGVRRAAAVAIGHVRSSTSRTLPALRIAAASETDPALARAAQGALNRLEKR
ncbi:MAG: HEAT repeat domain-containing protein [Candidatus Binatus sp.]|uniref:HEAT repeat domain-containing protein n=1 Tax=Candidatus Binatus sp. TaxID=2811406 RepID=UPI0027288B97|nr:HEAT repeat domain-containing protein [Candidatus Binatus sp.]MDO8434415.1 HEAT repeat domain-containing protein [Candidatus Binatus sp.]